MRRGEIWTVSASGYAGKPRPAVIIQDDLFEATVSVTICALTTDPTNAPILRVPVTPDQENGLSRQSRVMIDKVTTVPRARVGTRIGRLSGDDLTRVDRAILVFLGLVG